MRRFIIAALVMAGLSNSTPAIGGDPCPGNHDKDYLSKIGQVDDFNVGNIDESAIIKLKPNGEWEPLNNFDEPNRTERHFRVRLRQAATSPESWRLTLYDEHDFHPIQVLGPSDFQSGSTLWTRRIDGARAFVILDVLRGARTPFLGIDGAIVVEQTSRIPYYSVENRAKPNWSCLICARTQEQKQFCDVGAQRCQDTPSSLRHWGESVGMVMLRGSTDVWTCSGFLVSPDLFLTNWHCGGTKSEPLELFWGKDLLENLIVDFSWDGDDLSNEYAYAPISSNVLLLQSQDLDYAMFRVKPLLQSIGQPPYVRIKPKWDLTAGSRVSLIHHPLGRLKHVTREGCIVDGPDDASWFRGTPGVDFTHRCDSEGGSSGAPIFDTNGSVVGVHHAGFELDDNDKCDNRNKAVKIERILDDLPEELKSEILSWQE